LCSLMLGSTSPLPDGSIVDTFGQFVDPALGDCRQRTLCQESRTAEVGIVRPEPGGRGDKSYRNFKVQLLDKT